jgi:3-oxoacyl-[acyl-carrier protein] reductase
LGGVDRAIKALSDELGPRGIRVNGLMPAWVSTSRAVELSAAGHDKPLNSLRRRGSAEEFGRVATFLLSPSASYVTGAMIALDRGALPTI